MAKLSQDASSCTSIDHGWSKRVLAIALERCCWLSPNICCSWPLQLPQVCTLLHPLYGATGDNTPRRVSEIPQWTPRNLLKQSVLGRLKLRSLHWTNFDAVAEDLRWTDTWLAMQEFASLSYTTNDQHKELAEARMKRDISDLEKNQYQADILLILCWRPLTAECSQWGS